MITSTREYATGLIEQHERGEHDEFPPYPSCPTCLDISLEDYPPADTSPGALPPERQIVGVPDDLTRWAEEEGLI